jgi:hypothetical protein
MSHATLVLTRRRDRAGIFRRAQVLVDGEVVARLRPGASTTVEVSAGRRRVQAAMDWTTSAALDLDTAPGDEVRLVVSVPFASKETAFSDPGQALTLTVEG